MKLRIAECKQKLEASGLFTMSDTRLAGGLGISRASLIKLKAGQVAHVRGEVIDALCIVLRCTPGELIEAEPVELPLRNNGRVDIRKPRPFPAKKKDADNG